MKLKFMIEDDGMRDLFIRVEREYVRISDYFADEYNVSIYDEGDYLGVHGKEIWYQDDDMNWIKGRDDQSYKIGGAEDKQYTLHMGQGDDVLIGWRYPDYFAAGGGKNKIVGGAGDDEIDISGGNNFVKGGNHDDYFEIYGGKAVIVGGSGWDGYFFTGKSTVTIKDFEVEIDSIEIYHGVSKFNELSVEKQKGGTLIVAEDPEHPDRDIQIFLENLKPHELDRSDFTF